MDIKRSGSQPSVKGPSEWFTGSVRIDPLFQAPDPALVQGASVTFEPAGRTAWHTHPLGQTLIVTAGRNDERLAERMRVPGRSSRWLKRHAGALNEGGIGRLEKRVDANGAREPVRRPFRGTLRASSFD